MRVLILPGAAVAALYLTAWAPSVWLTLALIVLALVEHVRANANARALQRLADACVEHLPGFAEFVLSELEPAAP